MIVLQGNLHLSKKKALFIQNVLNPDFIIFLVERCNIFVFGGVFSERQEVIRATVNECENSQSSQNNVDSYTSSNKGYIGPFIQDDVEIYTLSLPNIKGEFPTLHFIYVL